MLLGMKDIRDIAILDHLRAVRAASVTDLAEATGSSIATIRRDLQRLDEAGLLRRTRAAAPSWRTRTRATPPSRRSRP